MKKPFVRILIGNLVIIAFVFFFSMLPSGEKELALAFGMVCLLLSLVNLFIGLILLVSKGSRPYGLSMLLFAGLSLLCSFTLCSIQPLRL